MAVYNVEDYLNEAIDSIVKQSIGFEENVQLILVDDGSSDDSYRISLEYQDKFPNNIIALRKTNGGQASARNLGLKYAQGKYINFLDSDDYLSLNALNDVYTFFEKNESNIDILAIPMTLFERRNGPHRLNNKFDLGTRVIDLSLEANNPILSSSSAFIKYESIGDLRFDENLVNLEDALLINKILLEKKRLGVVSSCEYFYRQRTARDSTVDSASTKKEYFTDRLRDFYKVLIDYCIETEGEVPKFIQYLFAYDLQWLLKTPDLDVLREDEGEAEGSDLSIDSNKAIDEFWNLLYQVLSHIDKSVIIDNENLEKDSQSFFMFLYNNDSLKTGSKSFSNREYVLLEDNFLVLKTGDYSIDRLNIHRIWLDIVEIKNNNLNISGMFISNFNDNNFSIRVLKKAVDAKGSNSVEEFHSKKIKYNSNSVEEFHSKKIKYNTPERNTRKYLTYDWIYLFNFDVSIPLNKGEISDLEFFIDYDDGEISASYELLLGLNHNLGLSKYSAYFSKEDYIVLLKDLKLHILPYSYFSMIRYEFSNFKRILKDKPNFYLNSIYVKLIYYILYPFYKNRRIWIFSDRTDFADDNAKHLFDYALGQDDNVEKYFAVNGNSKSFEYMKGLAKNNKKDFSSHVLSFASLKHKILYLFAEKAISSYTNEEFINPFYEHDNKELYSGLITAERLFLQHGVTKDDISKFVKKYNNNLSLILTVSDLERESFLNEGYNYDESIIPVLGFPRFDNLLNENIYAFKDLLSENRNNYSKQILFMPTWRKDLERGNLFLSSDYFRNLNSFLNNERLFSILKEKGYKLIFKPHAEMMDYLSYFNLNDEIIVDLDSSYQVLFKNSSLLITDFSSVFFDFAYLKKPVIYYQANEDYHYDKGYFDYGSMGFGEVIEKESDLIDKIEFYISNDFEMEDNFRENVEDFFKFIDDNNCKRVYEWILNH